MEGSEVLGHRPRFLSSPVALVGLPVLKALALLLRFVRFLIALSLPQILWLVALLLRFVGLPIPPTGH